MQTVISQIAFTFVDDAAAIATGAVRLVRMLAVNAWRAGRTRLTAPLERLALSCDVAGILPTHRAMKSPTPSQRRMRNRFDVLGIVRMFRALRDLT